VRIGIGIIACGIAGSMAAANAGGRATGVVSGSVAVVRAVKGAGDNGNVAVWLEPTGATRLNPETPTIPHLRLKITQKNKRFDPHVLVVSRGTVVDFPNLDPFFHNVFSMFDGKRFDLGLYEAGSSRGVAFSRSGVCYIFCNIHPEMSAVVVVVDSFYYALTDRGGAFQISNVPPGRYRLMVWHERYKAEHQADFPRDVDVSGGGASLGIIRLVESDEAVAPHKNKYGGDYNPPAPSSPVYP
jgi:plastocyanin